MNRIIGLFWAIFMLVWATNLWSQTLVDLGGISNDGGAFVNFGIADSSNNEKVAMPLTLLSPVAISKVVVHLSKVNNPTDNVVVEVRQGSPNGALLASGSVPGSSISASGSRHELTVPAFVVPSGSIAVVYSRSGPSDPRNFFIAVRGTSGSNYGVVSSGGYMYLRTGAGWGSSDLQNSPKVSLFGTLVSLGQAAVSPSSSINFGNVTVGQTAQAQFRIKNTGTAALTINSATSNNSVFTLASAIPPSVNVNVGDSTLVTVSFTPTSAGSASGNITFAHNGINNPTIVSVVGNGVTPPTPPITPTPAPVISVSVSSLTLDSTAVGSVSQRTFVVSNTGAAVLTFTPSLSGADPSQFVVAPSAGASVSPGNSQVVTVIFTPTSVGNKSAVISLTNNASAGPTAVSLSGQGFVFPSPPLPLPSISVVPISLAMDSTLVGSASQKSFVVLNTGGSNLVISGATVSGAAAAQFGVAPSSVTLASGAGQTFTVSFAPASAGVKSVSIALAHNAVGAPTLVAVSGRGFMTPAPPPPTPAPVISVSVSSLTLDSTAVGSVSQKTFSITNIGTADLAVTGIVVSGLDAAQFSVSPSSAILTPGGSRIITVDFLPASAGSKSATLTLVHTAVTSPTTIALSGVGRLAPQSLAALSTLSLTFDSTTVSSFSQKSFTVSNTGAAGLIVPGIVLSGADAGQFAVSPISFSVAAGASPRTVTVNFSPSSGGAKSASLVITHNAPGSPSVVFLSGVGKSTLSPSAIASGPSYAKPVVNISASTVSGEAPLEVMFVNNNTGGPISWWEWQFRNKTISGTPEFVTSRSPLSAADTITHTLADPGVYLVQLSVEGSGGGDTNTLKDSIVVVVAVPRMEVSVQSLVFGQTVVLQDKPELDFEVVNPSKAQLVADLTISGPDAVDFKIDPVHLSLARGSAPQKFKVVFQPTIIGPKKASVVISHNAASGPDTISLSGSAILAADFNGDYRVDLKDFFLLAEQFDILPITNRNNRYDLNGDRLVTHEDFYLFGEFFGR